MSEEREELCIVRTTRGPFPDQYLIRHGTDSVTIGVTNPADALRQTREKWERDFVKWDDYVKIYGLVIEETLRPEFLDVKVIGGCI